MKSLKRILAAMLLLAFMVGIVACGKKEADVERKTTTTTQTTTAQEDETTGEQETQGETEKTKKEDKTESTIGQSVTNVVQKTNSGKNDRTTKKTKETTKNIKKTIKKGSGNKTKKKTKPTLPTTNPAHSSTVAPVIPRTKDKYGNPSEAFIASCKGFTLKILDPWGGAQIGDPIYESGAYVRQTVEAELDCTIKEDGFFEGYAAAMSASLAAGKPQAHIYRVQDFSFAGFLDKSYFCDLTAAMKKSGVDMREPWYDQECRAFFNVNNKQIAWSLSGYDPFKIYYNKNMIAKQHLTDPVNLVKSGKWTWDTLVTYSQKLKTATVDGLVVMEGSAEHLLKGMVTSYGKTTTKVSTGTSPTTNIEDNTVKSCLSKLQEWNSKGYVKLGGGDWTAAKKAFGTGKAAMIYGTGDVLSAMSKTDFNSDIGVVPFPKPSTAQTKYYSVVRSQFPIFIPAMHKNEAPKALFVYNEMRRQSYRFGLRDFVINNMEYFKGQDLDMMTDLCFCKGNFAVKNDWGFLCETGAPTTGTIVNAVATGKQTAQGAIDEYIDALKQTYNDIWSGKKITGQF